MAADKIAIVTGAGTGVGRAASLALMRIGYAVVLAGRRLNMLEETQKLGAEFGGKSLPVPSDMTDSGSIAALFAKAVRNLEHLLASPTPSPNFGAKPTPERRLAR